MRTQINGKEEPWTPEIEALWAKVTASPRFDGVHVKLSNCYDARPRRNEYDRGSDRAGFTYVCGDDDNWTGDVGSVSWPAKPGVSPLEAWERWKADWS